MTALRRHLLAAAIASVLIAVAGSAAAAEPAADKPTAKSEPIFGYQLMTSQERDEYRAKMRNAASATERRMIREEHHAAMVERAKERGVTLPDRTRGAGPYGPGQGRGPGAGPRGPGMDPGMGPGTRMGPPEGRGPGYGPGAGQPQ